MKRVVRVEKRKELLSLSLIYTNGEVRSFLSAQMSDDHVMNHTRVLSLKEGNTRAEKRGLDSGVSEREREKGRRKKTKKRERRGYLFLAAFNLVRGRGALKKRGETTRKRAKEGTNEA